MFANSFQWWHAVLIFVVANAVSALPAGFGGDFDFYNNFKKPAVSPPDWLFAPAWLVLNITSLIALYRVANLGSSSEVPASFYWSEAFGWLFFAMFTTLYFVLRSPILGAIDTVLGLFAAIISLALVFRLDLVATGLIGLRAAWLLLATYVSTYVAIHNPDGLFGR